MTTRADKPIPAPGPYDVWINGNCHQASQEIAAHIRFLNDLNSQFATRLARQAEENGALNAKIAALLVRVAHWTPALKEAVIWRARRSEADRTAMMSVYELSDEELDGWMERFDRFGQDGLKVTTIQKVGRTA